MFKRVKKEELKVPADISNLGKMRDFISKIGRKYGVSDTVINSFKMAIDEAGTNIIRHAYRDWEGFITIRMIIRETNVTVSLIDQGRTFDPRNVKDPDLNRYVDIGKKGGLGIFIIRKVIDDINYRKTVEGNELRLTKNREIVHDKKVVMPELSISMKTRYSLIASFILFFFILVLSVWNYIYQSKKVFNQYLEVGRTLAVTIVQNSLDFLAKEETWELARVSAEAQQNHTPLVLEILIVDSTNVIQGAVGMDNIMEHFKKPDVVKQDKNNLYVFKYKELGLVYDIVEEANSEIEGVKYHLGMVHIMLNKKYVDAKVFQTKKSVLWTSFLILVGGCFGVFILVYVTMSPFRRLSFWVKALGRGEAQDEMEFDSTDEVGEIAQAFSDITDKFRKTQENLAEQERLQKEVQVAQEIQQTLLPSVFPDVEGYELATHYEAAKEVGGDYYDFVEVDNETLGIVVADVSGKGVPGSLVMTMIRTALRTEARGNKDAADVLTKVNNFVIKDMKRGMFVTVFYIILDSKTRTINFASAGHNPMILYRESTNRSYYLNPRGFPIGINLPDDSLFNKTIESETLRLKVGDSLIAYTDGITEAMNHDRERFGDERFLAAIREFGDLEVEPLVNKIRDEITLFTEGYVQTDDITLVAIREKLKAEDVIFNHRLKLLKLVDEEGLSVKKACQMENISISTYYKYRKIFNKKGEKGLKETIKISDFEEKQISIEDRAKMVDIIKNHPEYGAKRISEELKSEIYDHVQINEKRIYDELVRSHLNTKELRISFIEKGDRGRRLKPPGTPFVSLEGEVVDPSKIEQLNLRKEQKYKTDKSGKKKSGDAVSEEKDEKILTEYIPEKEGVGEEKTETIMDEFFEFSDLEENDDEISEGILSELDKGIGTEEETEIEGKVDFDSTGNYLGDDVIDDIKKEKDIDKVLDVEDDFFSRVSGDSQFEDDITSSVANDFLEGESVFDDIMEMSEDDFFLSMTDGYELDKESGLSEKLDRSSEKEEVASSEKKKNRLLKSGKWFYKQGLYEKAIVEIKKSLEEDSDSIEAIQCLGDAYFRIGDLEKAGFFYNKVRHLQPENLYVLENLGVVYANSGEYKKAVLQWGEVLKRSPNREDLVDRIKRMQQALRKQYL